jgi:hypothetical protein
MTPEFMEHALRQIYYSLKILDVEQEIKDSWDEGEYFDANNQTRLAEFIGIMYALDEDWQDIYTEPDFLKWDTYPTKKGAKS